MRNSVLFVTAFVALTLVAGEGFSEAEPIAPGRAGAIELVEGACPLFQWIEAEGADGYLLEVFRLSDGYEEGKPTAPPVVQYRVPSGIDRWQPPSSDCLEPGVGYGWSISSGSSDSGERSAERSVLLFRVSGGEGTKDASGRRMVSLPEASHISRPPFKVEGSGIIEVWDTSAHLGAALIPNSLGASLNAIDDFGGSRELDVTRSGIAVIKRLAVGKVAADATNIIEVVQNSTTDPIADAWTTYSSRRWKREIRDLESPLEKVSALRGVSFEWKSSGDSDIGLIAEEVAPIVPEVVRWDHGEEGHPQAIDYGRLVPLLVEAMKEQQRTLDDLRRTVDELARATPRPKD